jgi:hypothetical protein
MAENKDLLVGEDLEKAIAAAEAEYDENRVVEKAEYVETDDKYASQPDVTEPEPELSIEEEFPDYVMPIGLQSTFVRGTNRYQLSGAICGYAGYLLLIGLLGITGIYEADTSGFMGPIMGLLVGYGIGYYLTKKKTKQVEEDLARMRAERDAKAAE